MRIDRNFQDYQRSIAAELTATKDRVRHLIGSDHWLTEGEHKEAVLRGVLRTHVPDTFHVGKGFVCGPDENSHQIDVLLTHREKPTLFRDGELMFVTADAAAKIVEVKTSVHRNQIKRVLTKLADDAEMIRAGGNAECRAGLFIYNAGPEHSALLKAVQAASNGRPERVINWIAAGPDVFVRYWSDGRQAHSPVDGAVWHSYQIRGLAYAYFVSNVIWDTGLDDDPRVRAPWFSIQGGKERFRDNYCALDGRPVVNQDRQVGGGQNG